MLLLDEPDAGLDEASVEASAIGWTNCEHWATVCSWQRTTSAFATTPRICWTSPVEAVSPWRWPPRPTTPAFIEHAGSNPSDVPSGVFDAPPHHDVAQHQRHGGLLTLGVLLAMGEFMERSGRHATTRVCPRPNHGGGLCGEPLVAALRGKSERCLVAGGQWSRAARRLAALGFGADHAGFCSTPPSGRPDGQTMLVGATLCFIGVARCGMDATLHPTTRTPTGRFCGIADAGSDSTVFAPHQPSCLRGTSSSRGIERHLRP